MGGSIEHVEHIPDIHVGTALNVGDMIVVLSSGASILEVTSPVSGTVVEINKDIKDGSDLDTLELLDTDPQGAGWILKMRLTDLSTLGKLMNFEEYRNSYDE